MDAEAKLYSDHHILIHRVAVKLDEKPAPLRLDAFLKKQYKNRSREQVKKAIEGGGISVVRTNKEYLPVGKLKPSLHLFPGDEVHVLTKRNKEPRVSFDYSVVYEDEHILVINKPGNLPVHPAGKFYFHTLLIHLRTEGFKIPLEAKRQYYLPHRIDRETSGLMVLAKSPEIATHLVEQFASRTTHKKYLAITHGHITKEEFDVTIPLGRKSDSKIRVKMHELSQNQGGLEAITLFKTIQRFTFKDKPMTLVECTLKTGRQHQIRAHLSLIGHSIVGDKLYGLEDDEASLFFEIPKKTKKSLLNLDPTEAKETLKDDSQFILSDRYVSAELQAKLMIERHALHAAHLSFIHPVTQKQVEFNADLPDLMKNML